jgi:hypothetical protein
MVLNIERLEREKKMMKDRMFELEHELKLSKNELKDKSANEKQLEDKIK